MDPTLTDTLRHRLQNYSSAVERTFVHFHDQERAGTSPAYAPYYERALTLASFDAVTNTGVGIPPEIWQEYTRITRWFEAFEQAAGPDLRRTLLAELTDFTQTYQAAICYAYLGEPANPPARQPPEREIIGVLLGELKKDHELADLERLITSLDENIARIAGMPEEPAPVMDTLLMSTPGETAGRCDRGIP